MNFLKPLAGIALALGACVANAAVVDFDGAKSSSFVYLYGEDGYGIVDLSFAPMSIAPISKGSSDKTLTASDFIFANDSLKPFDLESIDLGNLSGVRKNGGAIDLYYTVAGSSKLHEETLTLDSNKGLETFSQVASGSDELLALNDITSFTLIGLKGLTFQADNINVTPYTAPAVPEPANAALLASALALLGVVARRRKA